MDFGWWGDEDIRAAVDFLAERPEVDHIAALGLSMGGEEVIGAMAVDDRIEAVVAEGATIRVAGDRAWLSDQLRLARCRPGVAGDRHDLVRGDRFTSADPPITLRQAVDRARPRPVLLITAGGVADEAHAAGWIRLPGRRKRSPSSRSTARSTPPASAPIPSSGRPRWSPSSTMHSPDDRALRVHSTTTAVTMPNMPDSRSTWVRMWQCQTHVPGLSAGPGPCSARREPR